MSYKDTKNGNLELIRANLEIFPLSVVIKNPKQRTNSPLQRDPHKKI